MRFHVPQTQLASSAWANRRLLELLKGAHAEDLDAPGGRLSVGIGVGHVEEELQALGVAFDERGTRTDDHLAALLALWHESSPAYAGRFVAFADVVEHPLPVQRPHPPVIVGGHASSSYRRAVQSGNGWYGWELDLEGTSAALTHLREAAERHGRPDGLGELEISVTPPGMVDVDTAHQYADLGVHRLVVVPPSMDGAAIDATIARVVETLIGRV